MMELLLKKKSFNQQGLKKLFKEFIEDTRQNLDLKLNTINLILQSMKEESEQHISKSMQKIIYVIIKIFYSYQFLQKKQYNIGFK